MRIHQFNVSPSLPERLEPLRDLAHNLYFSWNPQVVDLFIRLDRELWEKTGHNPVRLIGNVSQKRLAEAADDDGYVATLESVYSTFRHNLRTAMPKRGIMPRFIQGIVNELREIEQSKGRTEEKGQGGY